MTAHQNQATHWLYGWHAVLGIARHQPHRLQRILLVEGGRERTRQKELLTLLKDLKLPFETVQTADLTRLTEGVHQGVAALCEPASEATEPELFVALQKLTAPPLLLLLDRIQDPRNLGACLRVAEAAGCDAVVAEKRNSAPLSAVAEKAASGACLPFYRVPSLIRTIHKLKELGIWIYGADAEADPPLFATDLSGSVAWVVGGEGSGLRSLISKACDHLVNIPMKGSVASLNVSVAAAICLFETRRQRD